MAPPTRCAPAHLPGCVLSLRPSIPSTRTNHNISINGWLHGTPGIRFGGSNDRCGICQSPAAGSARRPRPRAPTRGHLGRPTRPSSAATPRPPRAPPARPAPPPPRSVWLTRVPAPLPVVGGGARERARPRGLLSGGRSGGVRSGGGGFRDDAPVVPPLLRRGRIAARAGHEPADLGGCLLGGVGAARAVKRAQAKGPRAAAAGAQHRAATEAEFVA